MFPTGTPIDISSIPLKVSVTGVVCCLFILLFIFWSLYIHYDFSRILRKGHKPLFRQQELLVREVIADFPVHGLRLVRYGCAVFADQHVLQTRYRDQGFVFPARSTEQRQFPDKIFPVIPCIFR